MEPSTIFLIALTIILSVGYSSVSRQNKALNSAIADSTQTLKDSRRVYEARIDALKAHKSHIQGKHEEMKKKKRHVEYEPTVTPFNFDPSKHDTFF